MTEKKHPTVEDLEKKLAGVKNTKGRIEILNSLVTGYSQDIYAEYSPKISEAESKCSYKNPEQKKDVEAIVSAIKSATNGKYVLRHETLCKVADGNTLTFTLDFNYEKIASVVSAKKAAATLRSEKDSKERKLAAWKREMLMRIANGEDFTKFEVN